jgi:TatD family-associated radical SAM protein
LTITDDGSSSNVLYWRDDKLYLNITNQCTNDCYFCLRKFRTGIAGFNLKLENEPSKAKILQELKAMPRREWTEYVFCGFGEPTIRLEVVLQVSKWIKHEKSGRVRIDTNGHGLLIHPGRPIFTELLNSGVDTVTVSLNAPNEDLYNEICRPRFQKAFPSVLEFIKQARNSGLEVEVTAVALPEVKISLIKRLTEKMRVDFRARPYIPMFR